jgi:hypothetical protein
LIILKKPRKTGAGRGDLGAVGTNISPCLIPFFQTILAKAQLATSVAVEHGRQPFVAGKTPWNEKQIF